MANKPIRSLRDIPGVFLGPAAPTNASPGDLWFPTPDVTAPSIGALAATGGAGSLTLSWPAGTDDVGVTLYEYTYGTAADFTGATVATTASLSAALTPAAGTYYCRYRARDAAGNWSGYSATQTASVTGTLAAPVVTAAAGSLKITDTWAAVSGAVSYEVYHSDSATAPTSGTTPTAVGVTSPYDIAGTIGTAKHSWIRGVDSVGNKGAWSTDASAVPFWLNDFAAGQAFDATRLGKVLAGNGSANVALNELTITSATTADAAGVFFQAYPFDKTKQQRYTAKVKVTARGTGAPYPTFLGIYNGATAPPATINTTVNNATIARICPAPYNGTQKWQYDHMGSTGTPFAAYWKALSSVWIAVAPVEADLVTNTDGTYYTAIIEHDAAGVVFEIRDASGNAIANCRTTKVLWADLPAVANTWWVTVASDLYTDYWSNTVKAAFLKYEENIGTVS